MGSDGDHGRGQTQNAEPWREFFGFDEPYPNQVDAIESAIEVGRERGYLAMEGPCGTGKTMAALTAAAYLVRHTDAYDNVFIVTPVKQQLEQFVADLRQINAAATEPFAGVALVGKADLCPYEREAVFPDDASVNVWCRDLRETTAELVETTNPGSRSHGYEGAPPEAAITATTDHADAWWDPAKAQTLVSNAVGDDAHEHSNAPRLTTAGESAPYPRHQPMAPDDLTEEEGPGPLYCPFEADWYARNKGSPVSFDAGDHHVVTLDDYLPRAVSHGTCPHRVMGVLLETADIVIGNYNHVFDPQTRALTEPALTDRTFLIVDEAHRLEDRVRDLLSDSIGQHSLQRARGDLQYLQRYSGENPEKQAYVGARLNEYDVTHDDVARAIEFYSGLLEWLHDRVTTYWETTAEIGPDEADGDIEIPLRDPDAAATDEVSLWIAEQGYEASFVTRLSTIGKAVEQVLRVADPDRSCVCTAVGALMGAWVQRSDATYFREILLRYSPPTGRERDLEWERAFTPQLLMYNCMPGERLAGIFEDLGGGILMSATLEPIDVFKDVVGLTAMTDADHGAQRPIATRTYDLPFPPENRASWIVDATPFTARNRGDLDAIDSNDVRAEYRRIIRDIAASPGNVMLCLPNYREAQWAGRVAENAVEKPVIVDESSSVAQTNELKATFFQGDGKVLVTSTRGTLTEGIDYDGDKLHTCAVIGIPLVNIGSPRVQAVKHAYADAFGTDRAFTYSLTIPAVRRARQALGRVIRGPDETGIRILVDHRYTDDAQYGGVYQYLPPQERGEFVRMTPMFLSSQFETFWAATE